MKTGRDARQAGVYSSECCAASINVIEDQMLPRCPLCNALTDWEFVRQDAKQGRKHELSFQKG